MFGDAPRALERTRKNRLQLTKKSINPTLMDKFKKAFTFGRRKTRRVPNSITNPINQQTNKKTNNQTRKSYPQLSPSRIQELQGYLGNNNASGNRREKLLQITCPNSGLCLGFNAYYQNIIKQYFNNFVDFKYLQETRVLSKSSANGMTSIMKYARNNYTSDVVLKCIPSNDPYPGADNLFYEAFVGLTSVNHLNTIYPVFVETYGAGLMNVATPYKFKQIIQTPVKKTLKITPKMFDMVLESGKKLSNNDFLKYILLKLNHQVVFTQTIDNAMSLSVFIDELSYSVENTILLTEDESSENKIPDAYDDLFLSFYQLLLILYQVYYALAGLENKFVHNDLHTGNVILYKTPKLQSKSMQTGEQNIHFTMNYNNKQKQGELDVSFNTSIIPKIIDYGRCFTDKTSRLLNQILTQNNLFQKTLTVYYDPEVINLGGIKALIEKYLRSSRGKIIQIIPLRRRSALFVFDSPRSAEFILTSSLSNYIRGDVRFKILHSDEEVASALGLTWVFDESFSKKKFYISGHKYNCSYDLRLLNIVYNRILRIHSELEQIDEDHHLEQYENLMGLMNMFLIGKPIFKDDFGTPPMTTNNISKEDLLNRYKANQQEFTYDVPRRLRKINNVFDAYNYLSFMLSIDEFKEEYNRLFMKKYNSTSYQSINVFGGNTEMQTSI